MIKEIVTVPNPILQRKAHKVHRQNIDYIRSVSKDLMDTVKAHQGLGLAAPQINVGLRMLVADINPPNQLYAVFINPEITYYGKEEENGMEMCFSIPGMSGEVIRSKVINVHWDGGSRQYQGLTARILQHEIDHLNGILLYDRAISQPNYQSAPQKSLIVV